MPKAFEKKPSQLNNQVTFMLNIIEQNISEEPSKKTLILFGNPRGGTTMIANVVRSMGIFLGDDLPVNLEDSGFNWDVLTKQNPNWGRNQKLSTIQQLIEKRNTDHDIWGWKYPRSDRFLEEISSNLINPMLICVFRDIVATTWRNVVRRGQPPINLMQNALNLQASNLNLIEKSGIPSLLISYEKAISDPLQLTSSLNQFMNLNLTEDQLKLSSTMVNPELGYNASKI
tara:strand:+ start:53 stop:739 length:687 start_codon:yes stop_codon:yes gene_type:complete